MWLILYNINKKPMLQVDHTGQYGPKDQRKWPKRPWPWKIYVVNISKTKRDGATVNIKHE